MALLMGCMSSGVKVTETQLSKFRVGQTTSQQVVAALGQPTTSNVSSTGERTLVYTFFHYQTRPESLIPYVGPFVGGADTSNTNVVFVFNRSRLLERYDSSSGASGMSTGILSGARPEASTPVRP
jgi:outer membrane protein assembly factor BamE (lipoprotein component of BamABCDE complex)